MSNYFCIYFYKIYRL